MSVTAKKTSLETGLKKLHKLLQDALEVEHATIPPYFTAWLSIMDGFNREAKDIIRSVFTEEMLHLTLAANILNAVGGHPDLVHKNFVPRYPHKLPHSDGDFEVSIEKFSKEALETFKKIERPETLHAKPTGNRFHTIGQFYAAIGKLLDDLCEEYGDKKIFTGKKHLQIQPADYYGSGSIVVVTNRKTAHEAIATIADQGEGSHHSIFDDDHNIFGDSDGKELAHYYRFNEIYKEKHYTEKDTHKSGPTGSKFEVDYKGVYPIIKNVDRRDYKGSDAGKVLDAFADNYGELLRVLNNAFNGQRTQMTEAFARMFALRDQAIALMRTPAGKGRQTLGLDFSQNVR
jgi:hypothetical protein